MKVSDSRSVSTGDRIHAGVLLAGAGIWAAFWTEFFTKGRVRTDQSDAYLDFEKSFLLAELYLIGVGLATARFLTRGRPEAVGTGIATGSALVFLGLMDLAYDLQHDKFSEKTPEMAVEKALITICLTLGPITMVRMWKARTRLS